MGHFTYVQDVRVPNMLHARVIRPPAIASSLIRVDGFSQPRPDVKVVAKKDFLAVAAPTEWRAIEAADDLKRRKSRHLDQRLGTGFASSPVNRADKRCTDRGCTDRVQDEPGS